MKRRITILFYAIFLMLGGCKANGNNNDAINCYNIAKGGRGNTKRIYTLALE